MTVTDHGKAVARLVPLDRPRPLDRLIAEGLVTPPPREQAGALGERHRGEGLCQRPRRRTTKVIACFDTSAIIPLIIKEATSDNCRRLWNEATRVASVRLLSPETHAALARAACMGRLTPGQLTNAVDELESLIEQLDIIEVSSEIARATGELAQRFGLRGYDAVHLAAGLVMNDADVVLVTGDHDLAAAAQATGIATALATP